MKKVKRLLGLGALVFAGTIGNAQAAIINFEDHAVGFGIAQPGSGDPTSGGFFFDMASDFYQLANNSAQVDNGSTYVVIEGQPLSQTTFSQIGGSPFALTSFDYAEWQSDGGLAFYPKTITVTGNQVGGSIVSTTLSLDGIFDGPGGQADFQTVTFGPGWGNLVSVTLLGTGAANGGLNYFAIDNIVVDAAANPVPEPGSLSLLGLSSAFLIRRRRGNSR
jgi:PEP-CTERM motif-containing protein